MLIVFFLSSLTDFLLHINWTVIPVTAITIIVVNMHRSIILKMLPLREAKDVISPTEAGIKKNAKWSKKKLAKFSTFSTFIIFDVI